MNVDDNVTNFLVHLSLQYKVDSLFVIYTHTRQDGADPRQQAVFRDRAPADMRVLSTLDPRSA